MDTVVPSPRRFVVAAFIGVFLIASFAFFWNLGVNPIANADEGVHALVTREIRESGDWLTLHIRGDFYFRKPPLSFWVRAATQTVFGENEFTDRLPSALAGLGATMLIAAWAWLWTRKASVVLAAGAIFPLLPSTFTHTFRTGETDGVLLFFLVLSALLLWRSLRKPWLLVAAAGVIGLAFMTKSVASGVVPIGFLLALLVHRRWPYRWSHVVVALATFFAVVAPWHAYEFVTQGRAFWDQYVGYHILQRVEIKLHITPQHHGPFWYLKGVDQGMFPWAWLVVPAAAYAVSKVRRRDEGTFSEAFLLTWGIGTVVLFSLAATKLAWYVAPAFPAFALLVGRFVATPFGKCTSWLRWLTGLAIIGYLVDAFVQYRTGLSKVLSLAVVSPYVAVAGVIAVIAVVLVIAFRRSPEMGRKAMSVISAVLLVHMTLMSLVVFSRYLRAEDENRFRVFRNEIVARDPHATVYILDIGYITSPLSAIYWEGPDHARQVIALKEDQAAFQAVLDGKPGAFVIVEQSRALQVDQLKKLSHVKDFGQLSLFRVQ